MSVSERRKPSRETARRKNSVPRHGQHTKIQRLRRDCHRCARGFEKHEQRHTWTRVWLVLMRLLSGRSLRHFVRQTNTREKKPSDCGSTSDASTNGEDTQSRFDPQKAAQAGTRETRAATHARPTKKTAPGCQTNRPAQPFSHVGAGGCLIRGLDVFAIGFRDRKKES